VKDKENHISVRLMTLLSHINSVILPAVSVEEVNPIPAGVVQGKQPGSS